MVNEKKNNKQLLKLLELIAEYEDREIDWNRVKSNDKEVYIVN